MHILTRRKTTFINYFQDIAVCGKTKRNLLLFHVTFYYGNVCICLSFIWFAICLHLHKHSKRICWRCLVNLSGKWTKPKERWIIFGEYQFTWKSPCIHLHCAVLFEFYCIYLYLVLFYLYLNYVLITFRAYFLLSNSGLFYEYRIGCVWSDRHQRNDERRKRDDK